MIAQPLFYPLDTATSQLQLFVVGGLFQAAVDTIDFADEKGGDQDRQFALPYLPGMDAVELDEASLSFRVGDMAVDIGGYSVSPGPGDKGITLRLAERGRLRKVELSYQLPTPLPADLRLIIRPADGDEPGPPVYAYPDYGRPGPTFPRTLGGMTVTDVGGDRRLVTVPDLLGQAWTFQLATGGEPKDLAPLEIKPVVNRVVIAAAPRNLSVVLQGTPSTPLWSSPGLLLPDGGVQQISFLPIAQRRLSEALAAAPPDAITLPLSIHFHSDSAGKLEVSHRALTGRYIARPLGDAPVTLRLGGRAAGLALSAPAGRRPLSGKMTLTARMLGRALNAGSPPAPLTLPGHGLRLDPGRQAAARLPVEARADAPNDPVPLAAVALRLAAVTPTEVALALHADVAGRPGAPMAPPVVRQLPAAFDDWAEFELPSPPPVAPGTILWATLRLTNGAALWHADAGSSQGGAGQSFVSVDRGSSWGEASTGLYAPAALLAQLFHREDPPYQRPFLRVLQGDTLLPEDWFATATAESPTQYRLPGAAIPRTVLDRLATAQGEGQARATTRIWLYSPSVLDLVIADATLAYDPAAAS